MALLESAPRLISEAGKIRRRAGHVAEGKRESPFKTPGKQLRQLILKPNDFG